MSYALSISSISTESAIKYSVDPNKAQKEIGLSFADMKAHGKAIESAAGEKFSNFPFAILHLRKTFFVCSHAICHFTADYVVEFQREKSRIGENKIEEITLLCKEEENFFEKSHSM